LEEEHRPEREEEYVLIIPEDGAEIVYEKEPISEEMSESLESKIDRKEREETAPSSGFTNGHTNGMRVPKYPQVTEPFKGDQGAINGFTNGLTNGFTNGLTNGLRAIRSGLTNGLTNGNGITNGLGYRKSESKGKRGKLKMAIVPIVVLLMVFSPYIINQITESPEGIDIDGRFGDWRGVTTFTDVEEIPGFNTNVDIVDYRIDDRRMDLSFYLRVEGNMLSGEPGGERRVDCAYVFIDSDRNVETGYFVEGIGADYMLEIYGWEQKVMKSSISDYDAILQDWNLFKTIGSVTSAVRGAELEVKVPLSTMGLDKKDSVDALFYMQSWDGFDDFSDTVISNEEGVLLVEQVGASPDVITGNGNRILRLDLKALESDIILETLRLQRSGHGDERDIGRVALEDQFGNFVALGTELGNEIEFQVQYSIAMDQTEILYVVIDIASNAQPENSVGFFIDNKNDVNTDLGVAHLKRLKPEFGKNEVGYIMAIPENITIDGAFSDWESHEMKNDTNDDVKRPDLDIIKYGVSTTLTKTSFYLQVDEDIVGGMKIPYWNRNRKTDLIPKAESTNTIGPEIPPKTGEDIVYIFVDSGDDDGYKGTLPLTANHLIEIKGRHNKVISKVTYDWIGLKANDWIWAPKGEPEVELDSYQMEVGININDLGIEQSNQTINVFFWATDWEKNELDTSNLEGPVSPPRGTRAETLSEVVSGVGSRNNDLFGWNVSYAGDVNDDGFPDIIVGAPYNDSSDGSKTDCGAAYIFFGYSGISSGDIDAASANVSIYGESAGDHFGWDVSDLSNVGPDTKDDLIVGAPDAGSGKAYIFYGRTSWSASYGASSADVIITGERYGDKFGFSVSGAQDTDSSSYNEVLVGAPNYGGLDWWNNSWDYRMRLTFDNSGQTEDLTDFPVLINLSSSNFDYSKAKSDGTDLRFIDEDGSTELKYHIEDWDSSGFSYIWVNVTTVDGSSSADYIHMYYGNSAASDVRDVEGTYNESYVGVWHLSETGTGTRYDATSYDNDASPVNYESDKGITGKIDGADNFDGINDYLTMDSVTTDLDSVYTVAFWMKADDPGNSGLVCFHSDSGSNRWRIEMTSDVASIEDNLGSVTISDGEWHYVVGVTDGTKSMIYVDGELDRDNIAATHNMIDSNLACMAAEYDPGPAPGEYLDGILDEVRVSKIVRSSDWIMAQYLSQDNNFIIYGGEEEGKRGRVYLFLGDGSIPTSEENADSKIMGEYGGDQFGYSISNAGDVDNDGKDDVIIGAPFNDEIGTNSGKAYIFYFRDVYNYVSSNVTTMGFITDFADAKSATDSGAYATLKEKGVKYLLERFSETFPQTAIPWTGSNQDESWKVITVSEPNDISISSGTADQTPLSEPNDISISSGTADQTPPSPSGDPVLRMEDCDDPWGTGDIVWASVDLSGYEDVVIEYYWQLDAVDSGEGFRSAYSTNAVGGLDSQGTWNQMYEHLDAPEDVWTKDTYSIPNAACVANFKFRFNARATANGEETFIDDVRITGNKTYYKMDIEFNMTDVPLVDENYLQLNYSTDGSETDFGVLVYNATSGDWDDLSSQGDLTSTSFTEKDYTLDEDHVLGNGYVRARFIGRNESVDEVNSTLNIEYCRVKSVAGRYELLGESASDNFGYSVSNASDINQDNSYYDVIVGAPGYSTNKGRAYIFHGGSPFNSTADVTLTGSSNGDKFGYSVSGAGDLDGDGAPDVIVGAPYWDNGTDTDCGTIMVFKGGSSMDTTSDYTHNGTQSDEHYGWSVSFALNIEGGSTNAVVVGAPHYDGGTDSGKAEVLNAFVIPEFPSIFIPITMFIALFLIEKKRRSRSKIDMESEPFERNEPGNGENRANYKNRR
jgi:hypothetical protein